VTQPDNEGYGSEDSYPTDGVPTHGCGTVLLWLFGIIVAIAIVVFLGFWILTLYLLVIIAAPMVIVKLLPKNSSSEAGRNSNED